MSLRTDKTAFLILLAAVMLIGAVSTSIWIGAAGMGVSPVSLMSAEAFAALGICLVLTSLNLALRWLRWHFLIRRFTRRIHMGGRQPEQPLRPEHQHHCHG